MKRIGIRWLAALSLVLCAASVPVTAEEDGLADRVDAYLSHMETLGFSGAVVVDAGGEVVLEEGYGYADRARSIPFDATTVNSVGSITKQFTGAAILLLAERGELSVDDPITGYFDPVPEGKRGITLHHLLTHTSGLPDVGRSDFDRITREDIVRLAMEAETLGAPGEVQQYANVNYSLLGAIVEMVSGRGYEAFLRQELFQPTDMTDTGYRLDWPAERLAQGYQAGEHWGTILERAWLDDGPAWTLRANGGIHSTVRDMHRWLGVLRGDGVLSDESVALWTAPHADEGGGDSFYGYGWVNWKTPYGPMIAHNGGNGIFSADFFYFPDRDIGFYIHGNSSVVRAAQLREDIVAAAFDPDWQAPEPIPTASDAPDAAGLAGTYVSADGSGLEVSADGPRLLVRFTGDTALAAVFEVDDEMAARLRTRTAETRHLMEAVWDSRVPDIPGYPGDAEELAASAGRLSEILWGRATRFGEPTGWHILGSSPTRPVVREDYEGEVSTWVVIEREDGPESMFEVLWKPDGSYIGSAIGPAQGDHPSATLIYRGDDTYRGPLHRFDRTSPVVRVDHGETPALILGGERFTRGL